MTGTCLWGKCNHGINVLEPPYTVVVRPAEYDKTGKLIRQEVTEFYASLVPAEDKLHVEGVCWEVTQPDEKGDNRFCPCKREEGLIRLYSRKEMRVMTPQADDRLITKSCVDCGRDILLLLEEDLCMFCKEKPEHYEAGDSYHQTE